MGCEVNINKKLVPLKFHYFFKACAASMQLFLPSFARQRGVPEDGIGIVWALFPVLTAPLMLLISNISDRFNSHYQTFLIMLLGMLLTEAAICFIPDIPGGTSKNETRTSTSVDVDLDCDEDNGRIYLKDEEVIENICDHYLNSSISEYCTFECEMEKFSNSNDTETNEIPFVNKILSMCNFNDSIKEFEIDLDASSNSESIEDDICEEPLQMRCHYECLRTEQSADVNSSTLLDVIQERIFWLFLALLLTYDACLSITQSLCDAGAIQLLGDKKHHYGNQRLFGAIGWGVMAMVNGAVIDHFSNGIDDINYRGGFYMSMGVFILCFISGTRIDFGMMEKEESGNVLTVLNSFKIILFMICIFVIGMSLGCIATFLLLLMEDVAEVWDPEFDDLSLVQGLSTFMGCVVGETPGMFFSGKVINCLGHIYTFSLVLLAFTLRFIAYAFVTNPWYFLLIEVLHGICYGIFFPNMTAYAGVLAPPGRYATMQGLVKGILDIGTSVGSVIGGTGFKLYGGPTMFLYFALADASFMILYTIIQCCMESKSKVNLAKKNRGTVPLAASDIAQLKGITNRRISHQEEGQQNTAYVEDEETISNNNRQKVTFF